MRRLRSSGVFVTRSTTIISSPQENDTRKWKSWPERGKKTKQVSGVWLFCTASEPHTLGRNFPRLVFSSLNFFWFWKQLVLLTSHIKRFRLKPWSAEQNKSKKTITLIQRWNFKSKPETKSNLETLFPKQNLLRTFNYRNYRAKMKTTWEIPCSIGICIQREQANFQKNQPSHFWNSG